MGQQPPERELLDRPVRVGDRPRLREVLDERVVEAQPALVAELEDRGRGERLRDRRDPEERVGPDRALRRAVGEPQGARPGERAVADDAGGEAGQPLLDDELGRERVEARGQRVDDGIHDPHDARLRRRMCAGRDRRLVHEHESIGITSRLTRDASPIQSHVDRSHGPSERPARTLRDTSRPEPGVPKSATYASAQDTDFTHDVLGRYVCNGRDGRAGTPTGRSADPRDFDPIVIGGGSFGPVFAQHLFAADRTRATGSSSSRRAGSCFPATFQDLPLTGLGTRARSWRTPARSGRRSGVSRGGATSPEASPASRTVSARSVFFGGWSPRLLASELAAPCRLSSPRAQRLGRSPGVLRPGQRADRDQRHKRLHLGPSPRGAAEPAEGGDVDGGSVGDAIPLAQLPLKSSRRPCCQARLVQARGSTRRSRPSDPLRVVRRPESSPASRCSSMRRARRRTSTATTSRSA